MGTFLAGVLTDLVVDKAVDAFGSEDVQEVYEEGTWIYVDRGGAHTKLRTAVEMASESTMFQDSDDVLATDQARKLFSPGFYINHVTANNQAIVYVFDTEESISVDRSKFRVADPADKLRFDSDSGMTLIRELYFERMRLKGVQYAKFQVGDEVVENRGS